VADALGMEPVAESLPGRAYLPDGRLVPESQPGGLTSDVEEVSRRAVAAAVDGRVVAVDGTVVPGAPRSIGIGGDPTRAVDLARSVRSALEGASVHIHSFAV